jgi:hypothetical protein
MIEVLELSFIGYFGKLLQVALGGWFAGDLRGLIEAMLLRWNINPATV